MELKLIRKELEKGWTRGKLYINGCFFCDTIEPEVRERKIKGKTAIPEGRYLVRTDVVSPRFSKIEAYKSIGGKLPRLENVPNFSGVLIHIGNSSRDTEGCILVGYNLRDTDNWISQSTIAFNALMERLKSAYGSIWLTVSNK